ncbi:MAG: hypothetical protein LQ343_001209 [Gyalolechia ehrenbergii]|nr:MAG: hypothetical protein LQ343_001209 [Gyalolechia ehrenbergii]
MENMPGFVYMVLRQLCHRTITLWESVFEHLRSWIFGPRAKTNFSQHRAAVATALAQLLRSVEMYDKAFVIWLSKVTARTSCLSIRGLRSKGYPMPKLNCRVENFSSYLDFIGKGVDIKTFGTEHKKAAATTPALHLSVLLEHSSSLHKESTFYDILASAGSDNLLLPVIHPAQFANSLQADWVQGRKYVSTYHQDPQAKSSVLLERSDALASPQIGTTSSMAPCTPVDMKAFIDSFPDPIQEQEWRRQTEADILDLQNQLKERKKSILDLEEKIYDRQVLLGITAAKRSNLFDEILPTTQAVEERIDSPGAMTLVEAEPDAVYESSLSGQPSKPMPDSLQASLGKDESDIEDIMMGDWVTLPPSQSPHQQSDEVLKRKRFSRHSTSKKVRMDSEAPGNTDSSTVHTTTGHSTRLRFRHDNVATGHIWLDDDTKPPTTARPISWPRNHLFRRSAGISVRKLTEVFEKICLQQEKP